MASTSKIVRTSTKDDLQQQKISQAVIIGDTFNQRFAPLTNLKPLLLLPLANRPIIEYILEILEEADVQEVFIFCCSNNHVLRSYIKDSEWSKKEGMSVSVMSSASFLSMGDMMRELDSKALIKSDFILINGAILTTFDLYDILDEHRIRRQNDKNCAITLLYRKTTPKHQIRCSEQVLIVAVESNSQRIRFYKRAYRTLVPQIPLEVFQQHDEVTVHYNLLDSYVSICSPCVPPLFSDNFDYQDIDDFVKGLIVNEELLGNSMYIHISEKGYGANISNLVMYDAVSQDIMARWTFPFVPDLVEYYQHLGWGSTYINSANNVYKANNVEIGRQCQFMQNVIIGQGTKIGENAIIANSVIGNNCTIGKNVRLVQSHLWDGVIVGDDCDIELCVLADRVKICDRVFLKFGCVLGPEVVIDNSVILPTLTRLQAEEVSENDSFGEDDFEENTKANKSVDKSLVGTNGHGYICNVWEEEKNEPEDPTKISDIWGKPNDEDSDDRQWRSDRASSRSERLSVGEGDSGESEVEGDDYDDDDVSQFYREVLDSLQRACDENVNTANIILEINSSKHAYNISIKEVVSVLVKALLKLPFEYEPNLAWSGYKIALGRIRDQLDDVIFNYIKTADTQYSCLLAIEDFMQKHQKCALAGMHLIREWYDEDILHELIIFRWFLNISPENAKIKKMMDPFIKWLGEAEEESSGD